MRITILTILFLFVHIVAHSQSALGLRSLELSPEQAVLAFRQGRLAEACPVFQHWREQWRNSPDNHLTQPQQEVLYYSLVCGLRHADAQAAADALQAVEQQLLVTYTDRLRFELGDYFFRVGNWGACLEQLEQAGIANLTNSEIASVQFQKGYCFFVLQRYNEARPLLNSVRSLPNHPQKAAATYYYGLLLFKEKNWQEALLQFRLVAADSVYRTLVPYYIAQVLLVTGNTDEAITYAEGQLRSPDKPYQEVSLHQLLGHAYFLKQRYPEALVQLQYAEQQGGQLQRDDLYRLAYSYYREGSLQKAGLLFKKLSNETDSLGQHALYLLGDVLLKQGDRTGARNAFLFCSLNSSDPREREYALFFHAQLSYELGFMDEALKGLTAFLANYADSRYRQEAQELLITVFASTSNFKEALVLLDQLSSVTVTTQRIVPVILFGRAAELINDGELNEADRLLDRALAEPQRQALLPYIQFWKGELALRGERFREAVVFFEKYLQGGAPARGEARPEYARYNLGHAHLRLEQYAKALSYFETLTDARLPNKLVQDAWLRLADCRLMLKQYGQAVTAYQKAVQGAWSEADYALYQLAAIAGINNANEKIRLLQTLEQQYPSSSLVSSAQMAIADAYMADERSALAIPYLQKVVADSENNTYAPQAYLQLGVASYNSDKNEEAIRYFTYLLSHYPHTDEAADALDNLRSVYVAMGRTQDYISFVKANGMTLATNTEDSLLYAAADQHYAQKEWTQAKTSLLTYLERFTQPVYALDAHFRLASIAANEKDWGLAFAHYDTVLQKAPNPYAEESALSAARICFFELRQFDNAARCYQRLFELTKLAGNRLESLRGMVRSYYQLQDWQQTVGQGKLLLQEKAVVADDRVLVSLAGAKLAVLAGREEEAQSLLRQVVEINKGAGAAEARYEMAASLFRQQKWKASEKAAFETIHRSGSYEQWVTRAYILLGDIFFAQSDYFNAKATYRSVEENAADPALKALARQKLEAVLASENNNGSSIKK